MNRIFITVALLCCSNIFMTFAWYGHLKNLNHKPWIIAALISWGIALFEYLLQVPANRIGHSALSVGQLKILQEVITLLVFVPFSAIFFKRKDDTGLPMGRYMPDGGQCFLFFEAGYSDKNRVKKIYPHPV